jgi:hypothetical protein
MEPAFDNHGLNALLVSGIHFPWIAGPLIAVIIGELIQLSLRYFLQLIG